MSQTEGTGSEKPLRVRRGRVDSLSLYEVTSYELDILEKGHPGSLYLNFATFLLGVAASFIIALATADLKSVILFAVFVAIAFSAGIIGILLFILWYRSRASIPDIIANIKKRMPPNGDSENH
jgi:hypothetical protein